MPDDYVEVDELEIQSNPLLFAFDPIHTLISKIIHGSFIKIFLVTAGLYTFFMIGGGWLITISLPANQDEILSFYDPRELSFAIFVYCIIAPSVWAFYLWQPEAFSDTLLAVEDVLSPTPRPPNSIGEFLHLNSYNSKHRYIAILPILITLIGAIIALLNMKGANPFLYGKQTFWWESKPFYFWIIWIPFVYVNLYMMSWIVLRQIRSIRIIKRLFETFKYSPILFHPDQCNGLKPIGDFAKATGRLAILFGFWVSSVVVTPLLFGYPVNFKIDTWILMILYFPLVIVSLVPPVWHAHIAMLKAKRSLLRNLAQTISILIDDMSPSQVAFSTDYLQELERRYHLLDNELVEWPLGKVDLRGDVFISLMPPLSTILAVFIQHLLSS